MFEKLEELAKNNKKISDFHIRAGSPLAYRQTGEIVKVKDVVVKPQDLKEVSKILDKNSVHFEELGIIVENDMIINEKTKVTIDELRSYNTNWLTKYMSS